MRQRIWFTASTELRAFEEQNKDDLTVTSAANTIKFELQRHGSIVTQATCSIVLNVESGRVKGSRWFLTSSGERRQAGTEEVCGSHSGCSEGVKLVFPYGS